ncbi:MAG TPA: sigma-70 family RNA polymerase sigma factor [Thermoanaerobaculia bacterium]|nr:sigma-70 family RNA polymerase sigma factor [Thermoanaerobaculia bacterium]
MTEPTTDPAHVEPLVDHLFRRQSGRIVAALTRLFGPRELELIQDAVQEAMLSALRLWPYRGVPDRPDAWLLTVARNRVLDGLRRRSSWRAREGEVLRETTASAERAESPTGIDEPHDDELTMVLLCCHPALPRDAQVALTLKTVAGFGVAEIARAFLARETAIAQRLVRAKRKLREIDPEFSLPAPDRLRDRVDVALEVLYLVFNEGHAAHQGQELVRADLCREAIRLVELLTADPRTALPEASALAALLCFQAARLPARSGEQGEPLTYAEQDPARWDRELVGRGLRHLAASARGERVSAYHLQAEIASCYTLVASTAEVDWSRVVDLYDQLLALAPSPVAATNRAVALAEAAGPQAGWAELARLGDEPSLADYVPYHLARGELGARAGRPEDARRHLQRAWELSRSEPVRRRLARRLRELAG